MGEVWELEMNPNIKFVLIAYVDHADHDGDNIFPSKELISRKTGYSRASVFKITNKIVDSGWLIDDGLSKFGTKKYRFNMAKLAEIKGGLNLRPVQRLDRTPSKDETAHRPKMRPKPSIEPSIEPSIYNSLWLDDDEVSELPKEIDCPELRQLWDEWKSYRKDKRSKLTEATKKRQLKQLVDMGKDRAIKALDYSMKRGWTGIFEEKPSYNKPIVSNKVSASKPLTKENAL